jgi:hypothetical protein
LNANTIAESNTDDIKALVAAVAEAEALETITQQDIDALNEKIAPFVLTEEQKTLAQDLLNLTGIGYPTPNSAARIALQNLLDNPASFREDFEPAIAAYKTSTEVNIPISGRAYQFAFVANNAEKTEYKLTANGTTLTASNDAVASTFYCVEYTNVNGAKRFAFISEEGKFLGYHTLTDSYMTHVGTDKRLQNDISFSAMTSHSTGNITSSAEDRFGTVAMKVDNRVLSEPDKDGCFILKWSAKSLDKSSAPYHNGTYTSAIKVTEVAEYTPTNAAMIAASTIAPLVHGYIRIGEGIGKYSYTYGEHSGDVFTDFEELVKATSKELTSADYVFTINQPAAGFYRIKSMNANDANKKGRFLEVNATGTKLVKDGTNPDNKYTSVFYIKDNTILSYSCGQYLNAYKTFATVGAEPTAWVIEENAAIVGTYALQYEENSGNNGYLSDWLNIPAATEENPVPVFEPTNGLNDANAAWTLEEVTWLPVPMNAEIGWATFYSPVQLALSDNRVNAYAGKVNGQYVTLNPLTSVPAETGVILELNTNETLEDGCVFLQVEKTSLTDVDTDLDGTLGDTYVEEESYVLSAPDGVESVGLYKAKKNFVNNEGAWTKADKGTHFLNNGFKAYLPVVSETRFFLFNFGEDIETAIESIEGENGKAEIYDLAGRRVKNAQKGVFVVNGKVIVK